VAGALALWDAGRERGSAGRPALRRNLQPYVQHAQPANFVETAFQWIAEYLLLSRPTVTFERRARTSSLPRPQAAPPIY
jgi:hypothetical protein